MKFNVLQYYSGLIKKDKSQEIWNTSKNKGEFDIKQVDEYFTGQEHEDGLKSSDDFLKMDMRLIGSYDKDIISSTSQETKSIVETYNFEAAVVCKDIFVSGLVKNYIIFPKSNGNDIQFLVLVDMNSINDIEEIGYKIKNDFMCFQMDKYLKALSQ